jgi:hypothetical protein
VMPLSEDCLRMYGRGGQRKESKRNKSLWKMQSKRGNDSSR